MVGSLDDLVEFLLEEIALNGVSGVTLQQLTTLVRQFYRSSIEHEEHSLNHPDATYLKEQLDFNIDNRFLARIWKWLGHHPDISIGDNHQYDGTSLDEIERLYPGYTSQNDFHHIQNEPHRAKEQDSSNGAAAVGHQESQGIAGPRFYVKEERIWMAICGHPPDLNRVFSSEWTLLLCIAAARHEGILQAELIRITGQDKRSVPKRTAELHEKGYIIKEIIYLRGNRTSRLYLRRFANVQQLSGSTGQPGREQTTVRHMVQQLFDVLKNTPLIPQEDLAGALGMTSVGRTRILSQLLRDFSKSGLLKRVKTLFRSSARAHGLQISVQFLREPSDEEFNGGQPQTIDLDQPIDVLASFYEAGTGQSNDEPLDEAIPIDNDYELDGVLTDATSTNTIRHALPQWNLDRVLANVLLEATWNAGAVGMSNVTARNIVTGPFIKRTLESLLVKISNQTLQAQPAHLRHLAILRLHEFNSSISQYLHYSFHDFVNMVESGNAKWEEVQGGTEFLKELQKHGKSPMSITEAAAVDHFGFAPRAKPHSLVKGGEATMRQSLLDAKVKNLESRTGDPILVESAPQSYRVAYQRGLTEVIQHKSPSNIRDWPQDDLLDSPSVHEMSNKQPYTNESGKSVKGRPRKFTRGTERYWRDFFHLYVQATEPGSIKKHGKSGIMSHHGALEFFNNRPANFDEILLTAIEQGLSVTIDSRDLNRAWLDKVHEFIHRSQPGFYFAPYGFMPHRRGAKSQVAVVRSSRLHEIDWSVRRKMWTWQTFASSASHSHQLLHHYSQYSHELNDIVHSTNMSEKGQSTGTNEMPATKLGQERNAGVGQMLLEPVNIQQILQPENESDRTESTAIEAESRALIEETQNDYPHTIGHRESRSRTSNSLESFSGTTTTETPNRKSTKPRHTQTKKHQPQSLVISRPTRKKILTQKAAENLASSRKITGSTEIIAQPSSSPQNATSPAQNPSTISPHSAVNPTRISAGSEDKPSSPHSTITPTFVTGNPTCDILSATICQNRDHDVQLQPGGTVPTQQLMGEASNLDCFPEHTHVGSSTTADFDKVLSSAAQSTLPLAETAQDEEIRSSAQAFAIPMNEQVPWLSETIKPVRHNQAQYPELFDEVDPASPAAFGAQKRSWAMVDDGESTPDQEHNETSGTTPKRAKLDGVEAARSQVAKLCRILVLELVGLCSGLVPNVTWTLRRAMVPRWREAGVSTSQLNVKNIRGATKALCESGKLRQLVFAFRGKSGTMVKMSILALRGIDSTNPAVLHLQRNMQDMEPADYIPPELAAEGTRDLNELNKIRYSKEIRLEETCEDDRELSTAPQKSRKRRKESGKPYKAKATTATTDQDNEQSVTSPGEQATRKASVVPLPALLSTGFLTLRVPRLGELALQPKPFSRYPPIYILPPEEIPPLVTSWIRTPSTTRISGGVSGIRRQRTARFDPLTHRLIWKKSSRLILPASLDEVPGMQLSRNRAKLATKDIRTTMFEAEVDCVTTWERLSGSLDTRPLKQVIFINHMLKTAATDTFSELPSVDFRALIDFEGLTGEEVELSLPEESTWPPFTAALHAATFAPEVSQTNSLNRRKRTSETVGLWNSTGTFGIERENMEPPAKRLRRGLKQPKHRRTVHNVLADDEASSAATPLLSLPLKRSRVTQLLRYMTDEEKYQVVVAVVLVRTLAGGIEKYTDWQIVCRLLPTQEEHLLRDAWKTMANRYRTDISELTEGLQYQYLEALEDGEVPSVNFDVMHATDWEGIFKWALAHLDKSIVRKNAELPSVRAHLTHRNEYVFNEAKSMRDLLGYNITQTLPRKEEVMSGSIFGTPVELHKEKLPKMGFQVFAQQEESDRELARAKSWVMATMLKAGNDDAMSIQAKLFSIAPTPAQSEALLERAVKALQRDKLLSRSFSMNVGKGRSKEREDIQYSRLRTYEASAKFFEQFDYRRLINTTMLKRAAKYKLEVLDVAFAKNSAIELSKETVLDDGEMVAVLNLFAMGMLQIRSGSDVPASRWGLEWQKHGYTTRMIDKTALGFTVIFSHVKEHYVFGDPLAGQRATPDAAIPRGEIDRPDGKGKIPIWFDITHSFGSGLWEMVLGAILGLVSTRPGVDARELARTLWYGISLDEVEMVLTWAERLDLVRRTGNTGGWETEEWWWFGVGVGGVWWEKEEERRKKEEQVRREQGQQQPLIVA